MTDENDLPEDRDLPEDSDLPEDMVREHWRRVCAWVRRHDRRQPLGQRLDDSAIASEVFEEALKIWRRTAPAERPSREKWVPWLSTITKYKIYAAIRVRDKHERTVRELQANAIPRQDHVRDPADDVASRELLDHLYKCVHGLPEPDRSILFLIWDGKSVAEAAQERGLTRAAAGMRVTRIKKYLRDESGFAKPTDAMKALRKAFERGRNDGASDA